MHCPLVLVSSEWLTWSRDNLDQGARSPTSGVALPSLSKFMGAHPHDRGIQGGWRGQWDALIAQVAVSQQRRFALMDEIFVVCNLERVVDVHTAQTKCIRIREYQTEAWNRWRLESTYCQTLIDAALSVSLSQHKAS